MPEITLIIDHPVGLHARPAAAFVKLANKFQSDIAVQHGDRKANAKSILNVLTLGAHQGSEVVIHAEGADAEDALRALDELIKSNFGEEL